MKFTVKGMVKLSFDITANADTTRFLIVIQWTVGKAKHITNGCKTRVHGLFALRCKFNNQFS